MTTDDYEHGVVPQDQRKGWLSIATIWIAIGIDLSGAFLGVALASGMAFWPAIWATIAGSLLLGLIAIATSYVGAVTGLSSAMISRAVFGKVGGGILAFAMSISLLGWFAVQAGFFGTNAQIAFTEFTGMDIPVPIFTGIGGVLMAVTAFWGYRSINKLSMLAVPLLLLLLLVSIVVAFSMNGTAALDAPVESLYSFGGAISLVMSLFILGVATAPDMARWAKTPKHAMLSGFVGFFFGNSIIIVVSVVLARIMDGTELMAIFFALGLGAVAVVVLILAQWTTNTTNLYSAGLAFAAISARIDRRTATVVLGIIGIAVGVIGAADYFVEFILVIGIVIAPFGGVYVAAFASGRKGPRWAHGAAVPTVDVWSIAAWLVGILVAVATTDPSHGPGFGWFTLTAVPALDGLIVGFLVYLALVPLRRKVEPDAAASAPVASEEQPARLDGGVSA
ncbi:cytosine permease [Microbacterium sp. LWH11-1.2]|uniref:cytosine permease n=1 Tax=Microbacterium sp. LWH11-1.2 TaxID=3135258 RepID=UPI00313A1CD2